MANRILYNVEEMRVKGTELEALSEDIQEEAQRMSTTIQGLDGNWSGVEYQEFLNEYDTFKGHQENFAMTVKSFGEYLKNTSNNAEQLDMDAANKVNIVGGGGGTTTA